MESFLKLLLEEYKIEKNKTTNKVISKLIDNKYVISLSEIIEQKKQQVIDIFMTYMEKENFKDKHLPITNANAKKEYDFSFDLQDYPNIIIKEVRNLDAVGLQFDSKNNRIHGIPTVANTIELQIVFYNKKDDNKSEDIKIVPFIVNANPKDLWKDTPSDKNLRYSKEDTEVLIDNFLDKKIVVASKRGRSHAHEGLFRDDHFCYRKLPDGWSIIALADGAGSAKYSRQGSKIATEFISNSFNNEEILFNLSKDLLTFFTGNFTNNEKEDEISESEKLKLKASIINILYKNVRNLHNELSNFAEREKIVIRDLNTTLIFVLAKKIESGYILLTFGVGDCPINIIAKDTDQVELLNTLDIGEFGGGTRFITMPEIFTPEMGNRFGIYHFEEFQQLFLMTDGIYDPKFVVESKLEDKETWKQFLSDLDGNNEDSIKVDFNNDDNIGEQLLKWLDFWSKGNHDDRTLAIIY